MWFSRVEKEKEKKKALIHSHIANYKIFYNSSSTTLFPLFKRKINSSLVKFALPHPWKTYPTTSTLSFWKRATNLHTQSRIMQYLKCNRALWWSYLLLAWWRGIDAKRQSCPLTYLPTSSHRDQALSETRCLTKQTTEEWHWKEQLALKNKKMLQPSLGKKDAEKAGWEGCD